MGYKSLKRVYLQRLCYQQRKTHATTTTELGKRCRAYKSQIKNNTLEYKQGIFFDGQIFDAYLFINDLIKKAKASIILIDNYIDETTLTLFSKVPDTKVTIYTYTITKQLKLDYEKYKKQCDNITLKTFKYAHDRFLILDNEEVYHIGASLKDLGKKWFAFSKMDRESVSILERLQ